MRTLVDIPDDQLAQLNALAKEQKVSRAQLVRTAIAELLASKKPTREQALEAAFGLWAGMEEDSVEYQRRLRSEW